MLIKTPHASAGFRSRSGWIRIGSFFMSTAFIVSLTHMALSPIVHRDHLNRPFYQGVVHELAYFFRVATHAVLYLWIRKHLDRIEPLARMSSTDQFLFCLTSSLEIINSVQDLRYSYASFKFGPNVVTQITLAMSEFLYLSVMLFGNASKLLLSGMLRTVLADISSMSMTSPSLGETCTAVRRYVAEINDLMSIPVMALHAEYFIWSFACFATNFPAMDCDFLDAIYYIIDAILSTGLLLNILYSGTLIAKRLQELRRAAHKHFVENVSRLTPVTTWGPNLVVALERNNLGITYDGVRVLNPSNVTGFFGLCWSTGFIFFQMSLEYARKNYDSFCSPEGGS